MKKLCCSILIFTMLLALFSGCGAESIPEEPPLLTQAPTEAAPEAPAPADSTSAGPAEVLTVHTVDELLAALGSDREIHMEAGTYNLTQAADYGKASDNPAYAWEPAYDGFQLVLCSLSNLTVSGSGSDSTNLLTDPRGVNVVLLDNCTDIRLKDFTAGHTEGGEMCSGGVLNLNHCRSAVLENLGLYGCGTVGVITNDCQDILVDRCDIYNCSMSGLQFRYSQNLTVENTVIHDLTEDQGLTPGTLVMMDSCSNVKLSGCMSYDNDVMTLLDFMSCSDITAENCTFQRNHVTDCGFRFYDTQPVFDGAVFEENDLRSWYDSQSMTALDTAGKEITQEQLAPLPEKPQAADADRKQVHVSTVDEFLAAIASDTEIILDGELYDLSLASGYGQEETDVYSWFEEYDGPELVITGVSNLKISSSDGDREGHTISATPRYADVLTFRGCDHIELSGFTAGHTKEPGSCAGGVVYFDDCDSITVDNCGLFGCGIIGVQAQYCSSVQVLGCDIYDCSVGGIRMNDVQGVTIDRCTLRNLEYYDINLQNCTDATVDGKPW